MTYTTKNTALKGRPIQVLLDGKPVTKCFYLDRRRRVIRRFKTNEYGDLVMTDARDEIDIATEEIKYSHRQRVEVRECPLERS